jgi:hypothetical protein
MSGSPDVNLLHRMSSTIVGRVRSLDYCVSSALTPCPLCCFNGRLLIDQEGRDDRSSLLVHLSEVQLLLATCVAILECATFDAWRAAAACFGGMSPCDSLSPWQYILFTKCLDSRSRQPPIPSCLQHGVPSDYSSSDADTDGINTM